VFEGAVEFHHIARRHDWPVYFASSVASSARRSRMP
jgi:hypothetical protein